LLGLKDIRTGIDLGGDSIKLVRGHGSQRLQAITHLGWGMIQTTQVHAEESTIDSAATALRRLIKRLGLSSRKLGHVAVALTGRVGSFRDVQMPTMSDVDLRRALPFEVRRHLDVTTMQDPILDAQVLGSTQPDSGGAPQIRVLFAAAPRQERDQVLMILEQAGLEAEVVDLQPLAGLNAVLARRRPVGGGAVALLDLGAQHAALHISGAEGDLLSRALTGGPLPKAGAPEVADRARQLAEQVQETVTFYRGRYRRQVELIALTGGGALIAGLTDALADSLETPLNVIDPLVDLADEARGREEVNGCEPLFLTACGLCEWWDGTHV
jgi:Tfp pilus assembly PilM family ATPase